MSRLYYKQHYYNQNKSKTTTQLISKANTQANTINQQINTSKQPNNFNKTNSMPSQNTRNPHNQTVPTSRTLQSKLKQITNNQPNNHYKIKSPYNNKIKNHLPSNPIQVNNNTKTITNIINQQNQSA